MNDAAYGAWRRQQGVARRAQLRFTVMIRGASTDEHDYARNIGKYEGTVLQTREEVKRQFVAQGPRKSIGGAGNFLNI